MAIMRFRRRHEQNEPAMALYLELMKRCLANTIYGEQITHDQPICENLSPRRIVASLAWEA